MSPVSPVFNAVETVRIVLKFNYRICLALLYTLKMYQNWLGIQMASEWNFMVWYSDSIWLTDHSTNRILFTNWMLDPHCS